jgi:hypothetical protein
LGGVVTSLDAILSSPSLPKHVGEVSGRYGVKTFLLP